MIWILVTLFFVLAVPSELYIYGRNIRSNPLKWKKNLYLWATAALWGLTGLGYLAIKILPGIPDGFVKAFEVVMLFFLFNGIAKIIFALLTSIGRKIHRLPLSYAVATTVIVIINLFLTYAATSGRTQLREERVDIVSAKTPVSFNGFRIVVISDIHAGRLLDKHEILENTVQTINSLDADIVINCGDIVNNSYEELCPGMIATLSNIHSHYGVYSVLGNHDMGKYIRETEKLSREDNIRLLVERQRSIGWRVLRNEVVPITNGIDTIYLSGLDFPAELLEKRSSHGRLTEDQNYGEVLSQVPADKFNITVSHAPQVWEQLIATGKSDLTVAGHVHSMQMKVKLGNNCVLSPASLLYENWSGLYSRNDNYLYVNDGIGYASIAMRIGCKPEITVIELRNNENNSVCGNNK